MSSFQVSGRVLGLAVLLVTTCGLTACDADDDPPKLEAGVVVPEDLPGSPEPQLVDEDIGVNFTCTVNGEMQLQRRATDTSFVKYVLDDETTVHSALYTFTGRHLSHLDRRWADLSSGNDRCPKSPPDDPEGGYAVLEDLPATATGYDTTRQDDYNVIHSQRAWARRGTDSIVSVTVTRVVKKGDTGPSPKLPVSVSDLALKAARDQR